jgi:hypothetical protein
LVANFALQNFQTKEGEPGVGKRNRRHSMKMRRRKAEKKLKERERRKREGFVKGTQQESPHEPSQEQQQPEEQEKP